MAAVCMPQRRFEGNRHGSRPYVGDLHDPFLA
jgi:hypothetical protein